MIHSTNSQHNLTVGTNRMRGRNEENQVRQQQTWCKKKEKERNEEKGSERGETGMLVPAAPPLLLLSPYRCSFLCRVSHRTCFLLATSLPVVLFSFGESVVGCVSSPPASLLPLLPVSLISTPSGDYLIYLEEQVSRSLSVCLSLDWMPNGCWNLLTPSAATEVEAVCVEVNGSTIEWRSSQNDGKLVWDEFALLFLPSDATRGCNIRSSRSSCALHVVTSLVSHFSWLRRKNKQTHLSSKFYFQMIMLIEPDTITWIVKKRR